MSRIADVINSVRGTPFIAIEFIWGITLIVYGAILLSPYYEPTGGTVNSVLGSPIVSTLIAILYIITGFIALWGCYHPTDKTRITSTWVLFATFFFTTLIRLLAVGVFPLLWIWTLLLALVAVIDNWNIKWKPS